jgi:hypothetical protein
MSDPIEIKLVTVYSLTIRLIETKKENEPREESPILNGLEVCTKTKT